MKLVLICFKHVKVVHIFFKIIIILLFKIKYSDDEHNRDNTHKYKK